MNRYISTIFIAIYCCCASIGNAQQLFELSGKITNATDGSAVVGATISQSGASKKGTSSNVDGEYSLILPAGSHNIVVKSIGYTTQERVVRLTHNTQLDISLDAENVAINQVVVSAISPRSNLERIQIGVEAIDIKMISMTPALFGENDIIKSITLLPGIKSEGDGSTGFQVRGGTSSQNLVLFDNVPIYNSGHVLGIFSVFNDDVLASAELYKGQIPAMFGGATSSVLDIQSKYGSYDTFSCGFDVGLLSTKLYIDAPIIEDKLTFFAAARRSYFDMFLNLTEDYKGNTMYFYDVNTKLSYRPNENNVLSLSYFRGEDNMGLQDMLDMKWGNNALSLKLFHRYNDQLNSTTSLMNSDYKLGNGIDIADIYCSFEGFIKNKSLTHNFIYTPNAKHTMQFGLQSTLVDLQSAEWQYNDISQSERRKALESSIWVNDEFKLSPKIEISVGLRLNNFLVLGGAPYYEIDDDGEIISTTEYANGDVVTSYLQLEPRMSVSLRLSDKESLKVGYSRSSQNIHALRTSSMSTPFDRYTMSSNILKPQVSDQFALGYITLSNNETYEFSIEGYYKMINNVYDYKDGTSFSSAIEIERLLLGGKGRAYGVEFSAKKSLGELTGWISYTLSWVDNKIEGINNGWWYTASNDRRHDISIVAMYPLPRGWHASSNFVYNTGQALTAPSAKYDVNGETQYYYAERNGYRAPSYHRLDISFTHSKQKRRHIREWNIGFYNIYNHYNPYMIYFENDENELSGTQTIQYSLFGIIPSVTYGLTF